MYAVQLYSVSFAGKLLLHLHLLPADIEHFTAVLLSSSYTSQR
jgi:hypothetical protein